MLQFPPDVKLEPELQRIKTMMDLILEDSREAIKRADDAHRDLESNANKLEKLMMMVLQNFNG